MHPKTPDQIVAVVLIDIAVIVVVARLFGGLARKVRQPQVVGEIIAGLVLGPSLLGQFPGDPSVKLFPVVVRPYLNIVAQIGLVIFMFIVGLELNLSLVRGRERVAASTSILSIILPFGLGIGLASLIYDDYSHVAGKVVGFWPFALFVGASMSVTAFPVMARILTERRMQNTELGAIALAAASVDDIVAWSLLAVVIAVVNSSNWVSVPRTIGEAIAYVVVMFMVVKPLLKRLGDAYKRTGKLTPNMLAIVMAGFLASSFLTEWIGIHQIFGAFLFGVVMPREGTEGMIREILEQLEQVALLLLLPVFFVITGLGTNITTLGSRGVVVLLGALLAAIIGKFVGATAGARLQGLNPLRSRALGALMNCRGLTGLVILNVGVSLKVLNTELFTILVLVALITTIMTEPLLRFVYPEKALAREIAEAERASMGVVDAYRVIAAIEEPSRDGELVDLGAAIIGDEAPSELVLSRFTETGGRLQLGSEAAVDLAQVTAGLADMQILNRKAQEAGVHAVVRAQSTDDLVQSLVTQVDAVDGDVLLVGASMRSRSSEPPADRLAELASSTVAVLADPGGTGIRGDQEVVVLTGSGGDGDAALELGVRLARSIASELVVVPPVDHHHRRHVEQLVRNIRSAGVTTRLEESAGADHGLPSGTAGRVLTVAAQSAVPGHSSAAEAAYGLAEITEGPVLVVRARQGEIGEDLTHLIARIRSAPKVAASASSTDPDARPAPTGSPT